jgi:Skp family chaperone for outer membrane proteins
MKSPDVTANGFLFPPLDSRAKKKEVATQKTRRGEDCTFMRLNHSMLTALMLAAVTAGAWAQTETASNAAPPKASTAPAPAPPPVTAADIQELRDALAAQQQQIQALQAQLQSKDQALQQVRSAGPATPQPADVAASDSAATVASNLQQTPTARTNQNAGSSDERIRNLERQIKGIGPISFSGDVRLRAEPFFGGPSDGSLDRARGRVRARFNATADLGEQFRAGLTLASGDINDPTTTNQTLTGFYSRKTVALDQAFAEFSPRGFKALTITGGKFRYPWYNTELTWDKDLNPEGAAETLAFHLETPVLKRFAQVGFQLPFAELAGTAATDKRITQAITYGGQLQTTWQLGPRVTLSAYTGYYDYRGSDSIALALARASSKNPQTPFTGVLPLASGNPVQDSTYTTAATTIVTVGGTVYPTGVTSISNAQFASKFGLFDSIARLDIDTGHARLPVSFIGDYVQNTQACGNLGNVVAAPANTSTQTYKQTVNSPCNSHYRRGYWAEGTVGRLQKKGDLQFGYARIYIEREAVLGNFNYSDIRQGTNVTQHRFTSFYQLDPSVQLGFTALVGRPLGTPEPWLTRLQFDTIYIF